MPAGQGGGLGNLGRLAVASSYYVAALPFDPLTMPAGGQGGRYAKGWTGGGGGMGPGVSNYGFATAAINPRQFVAHTNPNGHRPAFGTAVSYGAEPQGGSQDDLSLYQQAGAVAGSYASAADVRRAIEKKQADLRALTDLRAKQPWMAAVLNWQIDRIQSDLNALNAKLALQLEGEDASRTWRSLGQTGGTVAIVGGVVGVGLLVSLLAKSLKSRKNPRKRNRRR